MSERQELAFAANAPPLRIAIVAPGQVLPAHPSASVARVTEALVHGLIENGQNVTLLAAGNSQAACRLIPVCDDGIVLAWDHGFQKFRMAESRVLQVLESMRDQFDIVHAQGLDVGEFHSTRLLESSSLPNVTTCHSCIDIRDLPYFLDCRNNLIAISNSQRAACPDAPFIATVYNGLDPSPFPVVTEPDDYLCFVGRMDRTKQPHVAMQLAIQANMRLILAGRPAECDPTNYFNNECRPYLNHPLIKYVGEIEMKDKLPLLSRARCNLHPTGFREPFGLVPVEAGYCGTPTLAIRRGALAETIEHGRTGMLVEDFAEGFFKLRQCCDLDRVYIAERTRERFNARRMAAECVQAYRMAIARCR